MIMTGIHKLVAVRSSRMTVYQGGPPLGGGGAVEGGRGVLANPSNPDPV